MLRQSIQRLQKATIRNTTLKSLTASYTTTLQPSSKPLSPEVQQSENRATTWSATQRAKANAIAGPRFEQMDLSTQVKLA